MTTSMFLCLWHCQPHTHTTPVGACPCCACVMPCTTHPSYPMLGSGHLTALPPHTTSWPCSWEVHHSTGRNFVPTAGLCIQQEGAATGHWPGQGHLPIWLLQVALPHTCFANRQLRGGTQANEQACPVSCCEHPAGAVSRARALQCWALLAPNWKPSPQGGL
jgi:hypothetical protein